MTELGSWMHFLALAAALMRAVQCAVLAAVPLAHPRGPEPRRSTTGHALLPLMRRWRCTVALGHPARRPRLRMLPAHTLLPAGCKIAAVNSICNNNTI